MHGPRECPTWKDCSKETADLFSGITGYLPFNLFETCILNFEASLTLPHSIPYLARYCFLVSLSDETMVSNTDLGYNHTVRNPAKRIIKPGLCTIF